MLAATHTVIGAVASGGLVETSVWSIAAGVVASVLPDLDHPKSRVSQYLFVLRPLFSLCAHRGLTHSLLACALLVVSIVLAAEPFAVVPERSIAFAAGVGYLSHLAADAVSGRVALLWPLSKRFGTRLIQTGGAAETTLVIPLAILVGAILMVPGALEVVTAQLNKIA